jgi:hypothetical protein
MTEWTPSHVSVQQLKSAEWYTVQLQHGSTVECVLSMIAVEHCIFEQVLCSAGCAVHLWPCWFGFQSIVYHQTNCICLVWNLSVLVTKLSGLFH